MHPEHHRRTDQFPRSISPVCSSQAIVTGASWSRGRWRLSRMGVWWTVSGAITRKLVTASSRASCVASVGSGISNRAGPSPPASRSCSEASSWASSHHPAPGLFAATPRHRSLPWLPIPRRPASGQTQAAARPKARARAAAGCWRPAMADTKQDRRAGRSAGRPVDREGAVCWAGRREAADPFLESCWGAPPAAPVVVARLPEISATAKPKAHSRSHAFAIDVASIRDQQCIVERNRLRRRAIGQLP